MYCMDAVKIGDRGRDEVETKPAKRTKTYPSLAAMQSVYLYGWIKHAKKEYIR